jgi:hypothetical protein
MEIIQQMADSFLHCVESIIDLRESGIDFHTLEERLWETLMGLGQTMLKAALEEHDQHLSQHPQERSGWKIQRGPDQKTLITRFGQITYRRRYYHHTTSKEYAYLTDRQAGLSPHQRLDPTVKADITASAVNAPYALAGSRLQVPVTRQTVMNVLKKASALPALDIAETPVKRSVKTLYIEADEDHIALQRKNSKAKKNLQVPIIYVHEGPSSDSRRKLQKIFYLTGLKDSDELWLDVLDYIDANYQLSAIEKIFIGGDGAAWIKKGLTIIPESSFVLDRFHLGKYLIAAISKNDQRALYNRAWRAIEKGDYKGLNVVLDQAYQVAETNSRQEAVLRCRKYIKNNWPGIMAYIRFKEIICPPSAEGHVSHVLSDRLSSRPMAWCQEGAGYMANLRVMQANGIDIQKSHLRLFSQWQKGNLVAPKQPLATPNTLAARFYERLQSSLPAFGGSNKTLRQVLRGIVDRV